jgi:hypothetical protein
MTNARPGKFPNHCWSANYIKTPDTGFCEIVLVSYTNLTQWQKAISARSTMKSDKEEFRVNKLFSSDATCLTPEHTVMIKMCYNL